MKGDGMPTKVTLIYWPDLMFGTRWLCFVCVFWGPSPQSRPPTTNRRPPTSDGQTVNRFVALMQISGNTNIFNVFVVWTERTNCGRGNLFFLWTHSRFGTTARGSMDHFRSPGLCPCPPSPFSAPIFRFRIRSCCRAVLRPFPVGGRS